MQSELEQIAQIAQSSLNSLSRAFSVSPASKSQPVPSIDELTIPCLNLPPAHAYLASTQYQEIPSAAVEYCTRTLQDLALKTHELYDWTVRQLRASGSHPDVKSLDDIVGIFCRALENGYHRKSLQQIQHLDKYMSKRPTCERRSQDKCSKPTFNHKYTPLLEEYFGYNAYPSGSDKASLARRTGMTHRQMEVWFQNHRNRAKKDGRPLRRPLDSGFLQPTDNDLEKNNPFPSRQPYSPAVFTDTETEESDTDSLSPIKCNKLQGMPRSILDVSPSQSQPHTFPAPYLPQRPQKAVTFPRVSWPPRASSPKQVNNAIDMDEFVSLFALKLTIKDGDCNPARRKKAEQQSTRQRPWFESRVTIVPTAPLPALYRPPMQSRERWQKPRVGAISRHTLPFSHQARPKTIAEPEFGPTRYSRRLRPGCNDNQRRTSTTSTSSFYSSGTSEDSSSCNELLTPPASPQLPFTTLARKTTAFDIEEWRSEAS